MAVVESHSKHTVPQRFDDLALEFDLLFFLSDDVSFLERVGGARRVDPDSSGGGAAAYQAPERFLLDRVASDPGPASSGTSEIQPLLAATGLRLSGAYRPVLIYRDDLPLTASWE